MPAHHSSSGRPAAGRCAAKASICARLRPGTPASRRRSGSGSARAGRGGSAHSSAPRTSAGRWGASQRRASSGSCTRCSSVASSSARSSAVSAGRSAHQGGRPAWKAGGRHRVSWLASRACSSRKRSRWFMFGGGRTGCVLRRAEGVGGAGGRATHCVAGCVGALALVSLVSVGESRRPACGGDGSRLPALLQRVQPATGPCRSAGRREPPSFGPIRRPRPR